MPKTTVLLYQDATGTAPVVLWLGKLHRDDPLAYDKCVAKITRLRDEGHALRRPEADYLVDGIHELRAQHGNKQYRVLYFFHGKHVAVLVHAITKKTGAIPRQELRRARARRDIFVNDPLAHTYGEEEDH